MNPLSRITGRAVDRVLGFAAPAVPYVLRRDVPVPMPDGVVLLGDRYRSDDAFLPQVGTVRGTIRPVRDEGNRASIIEVGPARVDDLRATGQHLVRKGDR